MAEVQRRVEAGEVPQDVIDELQKLDGLMKAGKHKDAGSTFGRCTCRA